MNERTKPRITALAPWFGGKRTMAARIVAELGPHSAYWEPFCGSMAVASYTQPKDLFVAANGASDSETPLWPNG